MVHAAGTRLASLYCSSLGEASKGQSRQMLRLVFVR